MRVRESLTVLAGLLVGAISAGPAATAVQGAESDRDPVVIRFSDEQRLKTSLQWLGIRPGTVRPDALPVSAVDRGRRLSGRAAGLQMGDLSAFPGAAIGKLLFLRPGGETGSCTATFVTADNVLITAASCIAEASRGLNSDFIFISGYDTEAQRLYDVECVAFPSEWRQNEGASAWRHNYAFVRTGRSSTFGGLGITNALAPPRLSQIGFADSIGEGIQMSGIDSDTYLTGDGLVGSVFTTIGAGSSGNPWVRNSIVYSLTSHYDPAYPNIIYGPRFTSATMTLLATVREGCQV